MTTFTDTIKLLVTADGTKAVSEIERVGKTAQRQLDATGKATRDWSATLTKTGAGLVAFSAVGGAALYKAGQAASDLAESVNKSNVIFGDAAGRVEEFGSSAAGSLGQSKRAALDAAATFGGLADKIGYTDEQSADFAISLTSLASDLASFGNTSPDEAVLALGSALRGESEPIRKYNVLLNESAVSAEAAALGIAKTGDKLTEAQKVQARYSLILKQTKDAQGDFARTSDGLANQQRILNAEFENAKASLGQAALPAMTAVTSAAGDMLEKFNSLSPATQSFVGSVASVAVIGSGVVGATSLIIGQVIKMKTSFVDAGVALKGFAGNLKTAEGAAKAVSFAGAAAGLIVLTKLFAESEASANEWVNAQIDGSQKLEDQIGLTVRLLAEQKRQADTAVGFSFGPASFGSQDFKNAQDRIDALEAALSDYKTQLEASGKSQEYVDRVIRRATLAWSLQNVELKGSIDGHKRQSEAIAEASGNADDYAGTINGRVLSAVRGLGDEQEIAARKTQDHGREIQGLIRDLEAFQERAVQRRNTVRDAATAQLDVADALAQVTEAQGRYNTLAEEGTASQEELAAAQRDITRATIDYYGSVDQAVLSIEAGAAAQAGYEKGTKNSRRETEAYIAKLKATRDTLDGPLREAIDAHIRKLEAIPTNETTTVTADTSQAQQALSYLRDTINSIANATITPQVNLGNLGNISGFAAGGDVTGGVPIIVGEKGPELFVPASSGTVIPNHRLSRGGVPAGGGTVVVQFNGPVAGSKREFERMVANAIKEARRRGDRDVA